MNMLPSRHRDSYERFVLNPPGPNQQARPLLLPVHPLFTSDAGQELPAVVASLLFTVHPVHVEVEGLGFSVSSAKKGCLCRDHLLHHRTCRCRDI